jgi:TetR/AcrR family transcriptional repressor of nem operon
LLIIASRPALEPYDRCLGVSAVSEYGRSDPDISAMTDASGSTLLPTFESILVKAKATGEIASNVDVEATAQFMRAALSGLKISAQGGATPETLRKIVRVAL